MQDAFGSPDPHHGSGASTFGPLPQSARTWAMICHVAGLGGYFIPIAGSIILPLVIWLLKRDEHPFIDDQGKEALNFQITLILYWVVAGILVLLLVGFLLFLLIPLYQILMIAIAAVKSRAGDRYRYPFIIRFLT